MSSTSGTLSLLALAALLAASSARAQMPVVAPEPVDPPPTEVGGSADTPPADTPPAPPDTPPAPTGTIPAPVAGEPSTPVAADPAPAPVVQRVEPPALPVEKSKHRLIWTYPRFRWWEYVAAGAVAAGNIGMEVAYQAHPKDRWTGPILFDGAVRNALKGNEKVSRIAGDIGDWTWYGVQNYVLLDGLVTPLVSDKLNGDVALQLTMLNWQAVGLTGLVSRAAHVTVGRTRPSLQGCSNEEGAKNKCEFRGASFFSGHTAMTTASAALGCLDHAYLPLYGGGVADAMVCPVLITGAVTVGVSRIVNDKHWISDVIVGWAVGGAIGFGLPYALHYGPSAVRSALQPTPHTALVPWADQTSGGLRLVGSM